METMKLRQFNIVGSVLATFLLVVNYNQCNGQEFGIFGIPPQFEVANGIPNFALNPVGSHSAYPTSNRGFLDDLISIDPKTQSTGVLGQIFSKIISVVVSIITKLIPWPLSLLLPSSHTQ